MGIDVGRVSAGVGGRVPCSLLVADDDSTEVDGASEVSVQLSFASGEGRSSIVVWCGS